MTVICSCRTRKSLVDQRHSLACWLRACGLNPGLAELFQQHHIAPGSCEKMGIANERERETEIYICNSFDLHPELGSSYDLIASWPRRSFKGLMLSARMSTSKWKRSRRNDIKSMASFWCFHFNHSRKTCLDVLRNSPYPCATYFVRAMPLICSYGEKKNDV